MKKYLLLLLLSTSITFFSCRTELEKRLFGYWNLHIIEYLGQSANYRYLNYSMDIQNNGEIRLPSSFDRPQTEFGKWEIVTDATAEGDKQCLKITCSDTLLSGIYGIYLYQGEDSKIYLELGNDRVKIIADKWCIDGCPEFN